MSDGKEIALEGKHNSFTDMIGTALKQKDFNPESLTARK